MEQRQRSQIALIIAHELDLAQREAVQEGRAIFAAHSAKGILGSGVTVKAVSAAIGVGSDRLLTTLIAKVGVIANDPEAVELIAAGMEAHFENAKVEVETSARMASRRGPGEPIPSILNAAMGLFEQIKTDIRRKIEIARFDFEGKRANQSVQHAGPANPIAANVVNKGGKPIAAHWDQMWASIAVQLWEGDLNPTKQKDISEAMFEWFSNNEIDAGSTAVTERARALWQLIEAKRLS